jgi:hypothetical protein
MRRRGLTAVETGKDASKSDIADDRGGQRRYRHQLTYILGWWGGKKCRISETLPTMTSVWVLSRVERHDWRVRVGLCTRKESDM